jgi:hypothetical protein
VTLEGRNKLSSNGNIINRNNNVLQSPTTNKHMEMFKCMLTKNELKTVRTNETMICSGVLAGGGNALRTFLRAYNNFADIIFSTTGYENTLLSKRTVVPRCKKWIPDQILLNFMIYNKNINFENIIMNKNEDGIVYHQRKQIVNKYKDIPPYVMNENRTKVVSIVHHIDRSKRLLDYSKRFKC